MDQVKLSKFLSLVLRHKPEEIGLTLDNNGWASVDELLGKLRGDHVTLGDLRDVVRDNNKKRFTFNEDETKIRANQGHSIAADLELEEIEPPEFLYHGTGVRFLNSIQKTGITKQKRQHVHLSEDVDTARNVGSRHGKPCVIVIDALKMHADGKKFYKSKNGVWLTEEVETKYFNHIGYPQ